MTANQARSLSRQTFTMRVVVEELPGIYRIDTIKRPYTRRPRLGDWADGTVRQVQTHCTHEESLLLDRLPTS